MRRYAAPWWEELDREAFRFPAAREVSDARHAARAAAVAPRPAPRPAAPEPRPARTERNVPIERPTLRRHERPEFQPDRAALWAVLLGLCLIFVAVASALL